MWQRSNYDNIILRRICNKVLSELINNPPPPNVNRKKRKRSMKSMFIQGSPIIWTLISIDISLQTVQHQYFAA